MSKSSSYSLYNELTLQELKTLAGAKKHLAMDDSRLDIIDGFQLLNVIYYFIIQY